MTEGTDRTTEPGSESHGSEQADGSESVDAVGTYETADGVVFYDTENPLAWVQTRDAVRIDEMV